MLNPHPQRKFDLWPVSIVAFFVLFAAGLTAFIVFASLQRVDLVRADYYEEELRFQRQFERVDRARAIAQPAAIRYDSQRQQITVQLPLPHAKGSSGTVQLYRPADARLDREIPLTVGNDGAQHLDAKALRAGLWKVRVQWSFAGAEYFIDQSIVLPRS